ncbi:sialin isoform X2 [Folsomia candida]|uniref:sialin isoform X2 n=1 Tax=Folsomia candida TaxID=158441 RepID=UPI000B8EF921|nr:sialin isoform X2 [Folsomia candida]
MADHEKGPLNGTNIPVQKVPKARILFSARLTLALLCMFATWNFMFQRLTINFGLVCMVKTPALMAVPDLNFTLQNNDNNTSSLFGETTLGGDEVDIVDLSPNIHTDSDCPVVKKKNETGENSARFDLGEFEWSRDTLGWILASFYYGFVISQIPGGWCADRFGSKGALIWSGGLLSVLTMLIPPASYLGPEYLVGLRFISGIANGASMPAISSLSSRWFADVERGFMLGIAYAGFGTATAMAYPISAFFCEYAGWPQLFYFAGSIGLFWCVLTYFLVFEWPEDHPRISPKEVQYIQKHRAVQYGGPTRQKVKVPWVPMLLSMPVWSLLVANFCCFWIFLTISMYLPTYLKEVLHLDIGENGLLSAVPFVAMMSFHFVVALVFDRLRKRGLCSVTRLRKSFNTLGAIGAAGATILVGILACDNIMGAIFLITCSQVFIEFSFMGGYIFSIFELAPKFASSLTAMMNTFGLIVGLLAPPLVSYLTPNGTREEWLLVFNLSAAICAFGGVFYLLFGSSELQPWASDGGKGSPNGGNPALNFNGANGDKEMKVLQIRLISGESNINGEIVKN